MLRSWRARLARSAGADGAAGSPAAEAPAKRYRLVGYATLRDGRRCRVFIDADAPVTPLTVIRLQALPGRFDMNGGPLGLRPAPDDLSRRVRARLLRLPAAFDGPDGEFEAV